MQVINFSASLQFGSRRYSPIYRRVVAKFERVCRWGSYVTGQHRWSRAVHWKKKDIMDKVVNNLACWACAWYCLLFSMLIWIGIADARLKWLVKRRGGDTKKPAFINNSWAIPAKSLKGADKKKFWKNTYPFLFLKETLSVAFIMVEKC